MKKGYWVISWAEDGSIMGYGPCRCYLWALLQYLLLRGSKELLYIREDKG